MAKHYKHSIISKYKGVKPVFKGGITNYNTINSTHKWVEYCLDIIELNKLIIVETDWDVKWDLRYCLERAESKRDWNMKHPAFDARRAKIILDSVRNKPLKEAVNFLEKY